MKTGEVLTPRSFKTRAKNKVKDTKEFCKITRLITSQELSLVNGSIASAAGITIKLNAGLH